MASRNRKSSKGNEAPAANTAPATTTEERASAAQEESNVSENQTQASAAPAVADASVLRFKGTNKSGKTAAYVIPGQVGSVRVAKSAIINETFPQSFAEITFKAADAARAEKQAQKAARKETRAVSQAERAAKLEQRIAKANLAAQKNAEKLAKLRAKVPVSAQAQTEAAVAGTPEVAQEETVTQ